MIAPVTTSALIMAGGRSSRMRASHGKQHKALVKVLGVGMLERNILTLLSHNVREIFLAISVIEKSVLAFARGRGQKIARAGGAELKIFVEKQPLGTIGAARAIETASDHLLVVNVDNLTSLDLSALLEHHRVTRAALTVATHIELFQIPFGEVSIRDGIILDYKEKPFLPVSLCSGTYVLSKSARSKIPSGRSSSAPELVHILLRQKHRVSAFSHSSPWIDVNDASSVEKAEALVMANSGCFELWREPANCETVTLCVLNRGRVALLRIRSRAVSTVATLPKENVLSQNDDPLASAFRLRRRIGLPRVGAPVRIASFDELQTQNSQRTRHHIFVAKMASTRNGGRALRRGGISWALVTDPFADIPHTNANSRIISYLQQYVAAQNSYSLSHR